MKLIHYIERVSRIAGMHEAGPGDHTTVEYKRGVKQLKAWHEECAIFGMDPDRFTHGPLVFSRSEIIKPNGIAPIDWFAVFRVGYPSNSKPRKWPDIVRRIIMINIGECPYEGWAGEYFRIYFENEGASNGK